MSDHPIEALLRPPVEFWSVLAAGCAALLCFSAPQNLLMSDEIGQGTAAVLGSFALWRFRQGMRAVSYQRNLRRLPVYTLPADRILGQTASCSWGWASAGARNTRNGCATPSGLGRNATSSPTPCTALPGAPRSLGSITLSWGR